MTFAVLRGALQAGYEGSKRCRPTIGCPLPTCLETHACDAMAGNVLAKRSRDLDASLRCRAQNDH